MIKSDAVREISITADQLAATLVRPAVRDLCLLDSCGVGHLGSHLLIAGIDPVSVVELSRRPVAETLEELDHILNGDLATIFTISYDFGRRLQGFGGSASSEPDVFAAQFDCLICHDYTTGRTFMTGVEAAIPQILLGDLETSSRENSSSDISSSIASNFTRQEYIRGIETVKEHIRSGETYQANLTQQIKAETSRSPEEIFLHLRRFHPAPFAAFLRRPYSTVISASPERFFKVEDQSITASPIKGTRARGVTLAQDDNLRNELLTSEKDRAENTMIVDLFRNDLGRVCEYGSVEVEKLCDLEEHPTLFHLVSTIRGKLRQGVKFSEILKATFPCGSITGAPKLRTMEMIDELEPDPRGLSMGAIGLYVPGSKPQAPNDAATWDIGLGTSDYFDLSVAIRTMTVRNGEAVFNVGGGITIDSDPGSEYEESLLKAKALLNALGSSAPVSR